MSYLKIVIIAIAIFLILNGFVTTFGYDQNDLIDEVTEISSECTTNLVYMTGKRVGKDILVIQQLCTTDDGVTESVTKKSLFIDMDNLTYNRFNGWYRN